MSRDSGYAYAEHGWYVEPAWCVDALLDVEQLEGTSLDPSCGSGNIPMRLRARGLVCAGSDIADRGFGTTGVDFFESPDTADNIISNPPYHRLDEHYVRLALKKTTRKVCVLARLAFLESMKRKPMFNETPLARVWVSSKRISMPPGGTNIPAKGGSISYAWFVWEHGHIGPATLGWI